MGIDATMKASTSNPLCPHSNGKGLPVCWDCVEEGHINASSEADDGGNISPTWQKLKKFRRSFRFREGGSSTSSTSLTGTQSSAPEVHPPEEGLEVGARNLRRSQPGLIVVAGPRIVSPEDKLRSKPGHQSWNVDSMGRKDGSAALTTKTTVWGFRRRTLQILVALALLALAGVIVGVAVGLTQRKGLHSTSLSVSNGGSGEHVSSSSLLTPFVITETVSFYVTSDSSTFITLLKTDSPSTTSAMEGDGKAGGTESTTIAFTSTVFNIVTERPSPTDTIPSLQPTSTTTTSPEKTSSPSSSSRDCLGDDGSTYTDANTGAKFRIECAVAHQGRDIENLKADAMEDCVGLCAKNERCKGAIWYNVGPQGTDLNYCWLKSQMDDDDLRVTGDAQSIVRL
ncbi:hypothetical protein HD806DRAFT_1958 [Xylariaceae sp. AK1471]|nr:hypothetical protein HD806DRAFT_1958 [Xylariaceae sp. AK1471]